MKKGLLRTARRLGTCSLLGKTGCVSGSPSVEAEWWTTSDVADYLGVAVATVTNYRKRGQMPAPDATVGRTHMWRPTNVYRHVGSRSRPPIGEAAQAIFGRPAADRATGPSQP